MSMMNLRKLKETIDLMLEQFEKKEILEQNVPVLFQDEDDLVEASDEIFRIIETQDGRCVIGIDVSGFFEGCKDDDDNADDMFGNQEGQLF